MAILNSINKIQSLLDKLKINKHQLAKRSGITYNTLRGYLKKTRKKEIPTEILQPIAKALGVTTSFILGETNMIDLDTKNEKIMNALEYMGKGQECIKDAMEQLESLIDKDKAN